MNTSTELIKKTDSFQLRPYQQTSITKVMEEWETYQSTLLVLPTGCGKTIVFSKLAEILVKMGKRVLILAHREELLIQAQDKIFNSTGLWSEIEKADQTALDSFSMVTAGSVQTLCRKKRLERFSTDYYDYIIIDEAHHALSKSYRAVIDYFSNAKLLGVTATPDRGDKKNLGAVFQSLAYEYYLPMAIKEGYLSQLKVVTIPLQIELGKLSTRAGDYKETELAAMLEPYLEKIADEMLMYCADRKTIIFMPLIKISQQFQEILNRKGFRCGEVNGMSEDRKEVLEDFKNNKYNVLCNSMLLTEGYDEPSVDCVIVLRPTKIRGLYCQMIGRGTRLFPGKSELLVLDFLWSSESIELCRPANLIAGDEDVAKEITKKTEEQAGVQLDLEGLELEAENSVLEQRKKALAEKLEAQKKKRRKECDPLQFFASIKAEDLINYTPSFAWEMGPVTDSQRKALELKGMAVDEVGCAGMAAKLLDRLSTRQTMGMATPRQVKVLERYNYENVGQMSFTDAKKQIDRLAANGWRPIR